MARLKRIKIKRIKIKIKKLRIRKVRKIIKIITLAGSIERKR